MNNAPLPMKVKNYYSHRKGMTPCASRQACNVFPGLNPERDATPTPKSLSGVSPFTRWENQFAVGKVASLSCAVYPTARYYSDQFVGLNLKFHILWYVSSVFRNFF